MKNSPSIGFVGHDIFPHQVEKAASKPRVYLTRVEQTHGRD
jgi:hypothetical protein